MLWEAERLDGALGEQSVLLIQLELIESKRSRGDFAHGGGYI
jgi:hypothetical protein